MILKKLIFVVFAILVMVAILDTLPDPILQFWDPAAWSCLMWNLITIGALVFKSCLKLFKQVIFRYSHLSKKYLLRESIR